MATITRAQIEQIINGVYEGLTVRSQLRSLDLKAEAFYQGVADDPQLTLEYRRAQEARAESLVDEIVEISDTEPDAQKARNRIDTRKWYASKMQPQRYGDRIDVNVTHTVDLTGALTDARKRVSALSATSQPNALQRPQRDVSSMIDRARAHQDASDEPAVPIDPEDIFS